MNISPDFIHDSWKHRSKAKKYCPNCNHASSLQVPYCPMCRYGEKELAMSKTITNEQGGSQSFIEADFDCIPPEVLKLLAECLGFGARKYGKFNWKKIPMSDNLSHALNHINEWRRGDRSEPHLVNAMARLTFALFQAVDSGQQPDRYIHPDMLEDTQAELIEALSEKPSGNWAHEMAVPEEPPIHVTVDGEGVRVVDPIPAYAPVKTDFELRLEKVEEEQRLQVKSLDKIWESITNTQRSVEGIALTTNKDKQEVNYRINVVCNNLRGVEALAKDNVNSLDNLFREIKKLRSIGGANSTVQDALYKDVEQAKQGIQALWKHYESLLKRIDDIEEKGWSLENVESKIEKLRILNKSNSEAQDVLFEKLSEASKALNELYFEVLKTKNATN